MFKKGAANALQLLQALSSEITVQWHHFHPQTINSKVALYSMPKTYSPSQFSALS
jgi:hypothetical protein